MSTSTLATSGTSLVPASNLSFIERGFVLDTIEVAAEWDRIHALYSEVVAALRTVPHLLVASGHTSHCYAQGTNIMGLVVFSTVMGMTLGKMGHKGAPLLAFFTCVSQAMMIITGWVIW